MSDSESSHLPTREEMNSALFANLVIQQTNTALILLGRVPNPETGQPMQDLEAARLFIDQLEMLEVKTKGNLDKQESQLLNQSLTSLRMAFVQAVENPLSAGGEGPAPTAARPAPATLSAASSEAKAPVSPPPSEEESRKKFSKKY